MLDVKYQHKSATKETAAIKLLEARKLVTDPITGLSP